MLKKVEKYLHELFDIGLALKAFNGVWETITGSLLLVIHFNLRHIPIGARRFAALYIMIHGMLNLFLVIQLYRERLWAYLVTIAAMIIFVTYQIYRIRLYHSQILTVLTIIDVIFIFLTWHEYRHKI